MFLYMILAVTKIKYNENSINPQHFFDVEVKGNNLENYYVVAFVKGKVIDSNLKIVSNKTRVTLHSDFNKMEKGDTFFVNAYIYDIKKRLIISGRFQEFIVAYSPEGKRKFRPIGKLEGTFAQKFIRIEAEQYISTYGDLGKTKVHFTVGIFFDGTGNNRTNSEKIYYKNLDSSHRIKKVIPDESSYTNKAKKSFKIDSDSSYWNPYSNVALLFDLYQVKPLFRDDTDNKTKIVLKQYVQGIGTLNDKEDDIIGTALGEGTRGIIGKVADGCSELSNQISDVFNSNKNTEIGSITFDVFGFSRGAASARHFCNEIRGVNSIEKTKGGDIIFNLGVLGDFFKKNNIQNELTQYDFEKLNKEKVTIRFLGLFDTVVSQMIIKNKFGTILNLASPLTKIPIGLGNVIEASFDNVKQRLDNLSIESIVHLVAKDEYRRNFASTRIDINKINEINKISKIKTKAIEIVFDGAHSDIGGGYGASKIDDDIVDIEYVAIPVGHEEPIPKRLFELKDWIISKGYCTDKQLKVVKVKSKTYAVPRGTGIQEFLYQLKVKRTIIPRFSIVPMYVMRELALNCGVPFNESVANGKYPFEYFVPKDLEEYKDELIEITREAFNGKKMRKPKVNSKKFNFIHLSSNYNASKLIKEKGEKITISKELDRLFYVNSPSYATDKEISYQREIYTHSQ